MADGRVRVGFSNPYVALYKCEKEKVTYTGLKKLARGVSVSIKPEFSSGKTFYADNVAAETSNGRFTGGTAEFEVDGLLVETEKMIMGIPTEGADGWLSYGEDQKIPYVGVGFITKYISDGEEEYVPTVISKCKFHELEDEAETMEDEINYQTQKLTASILRADDKNKTWRHLGKGVPTEAEALEALKKKLGDTTVGGK